MSSDKSSKQVEGSWTNRRVVGHLREIMDYILIGMMPFILIGVFGFLLWSMWEMIQPILSGVRQVYSRQPMLATAFVLLIPVALGVFAVIGYKLDGFLKEVFGSG